MTRRNRRAKPQRARIVRRSSAMRYAVIDPAATIESASAALRACDADALLVIGGARARQESPVLSARDIVTLVVALGLDPRVLTVSDLLRVMADRPL